MYPARALGISTVFILITVGQGNYQECPKLPNGCSCLRQEDETVASLECRRMSYDDLQFAFKQSIDYEFNSVKIIKSKLPKLGGKLMANMSIDTLEIIFSRIEEFYLFKTLSTLKHFTTLILDHVEIKWLKCSEGYDKTELNHMKKLELIDCPEGNEIHKYISCHLTRSLTAIKIKWCRLRSEEFFFRGFSKLKELDVSNNLVTVVERHLFPLSAAKLRSIDLSSNPIESLAKDVFVDMPKLTCINLQSTLIATFQYDVFKPVLGQLNDLEFGNTPLKCDCFISWMLLELSRWKTQNIRCMSPEPLKYSKLYDLVPYELCRPDATEFPGILKEYCEAEYANKSSVF